jgi:hypothetical protein
MIDTQVNYLRRHPSELVLPHRPSEESFHLLGPQMHIWLDKTGWRGALELALVEVVEEELGQKKRR